MENDLENLEQVKKSVSQLIKSEKALLVASDKFHGLSIYGATSARRASASDRLTNCAADRDQKRDNLHADLVDAHLCPARKSESYETQDLRHSAGLGHSVGLKYTPKRPKILEGK